MDQEQQDGQQDGQQLQSRWQLTRKQLLWAGGITSLAFLLIVICGYLFGWKWTGLPKQTLWDWLQLLIIPAVLAGVGLWFNSQQRAQELQTADRRAQDEALQAYLDQIGQLLLDKDRPLRQSKEDDEVQTLARARTLTVLARLDGPRKAQVVQFLYESNLITADRPVLDLSGADLHRANLRKADLGGAYLRKANLSKADLSGANLRKADLRWADLSVANLSGAALRVANLRKADLGGAYLRKANLSGTDLSVANLREANLSGADLSGADLSWAYLHGADLSWVYLSRANLSGADLSVANLREANLSGADLSGADLSGANVYEEQLTRAKSLEDATMPDGQTLRGDKTPNGPTLEDWIKNKKAREEGG